MLQQWFSLFTKRKKAHFDIHYLKKPILYDQGHIPKDFVIWMYIKKHKLKLLMRFVSNVSERRGCERGGRESALFWLQ
jgi:hypothetical protein